jgi:hypothetical protein
MLDDSLVLKYALKYDELNLSQKERYEACLNDPDCSAKLKTEWVNRKQKHRQKLKENPDSDITAKFNERRKQEGQSIKALRESGSLDGFARKLGEQIASYKSELRKKIMKERVDPSLHSVLREQVTAFQQDAGELYYLREKIIEFSKGLILIEIDKPLRPEKIQELLSIQSICDNFIKKFANKYVNIGNTIRSIMDKLRQIAIGLLAG